jgi:uncharacterized protein (DUF2141 family)
MMIRSAIFFLTSSLLLSCAQIIAPGGGPRDDDPPKVVKYSPDSAQLNFNSKKIVLVFDEYIQLRDQNSQLIISPPLENTPDINVKNKTMTIDLEGQNLKPNTTYSINFGTALQDINENNPKDNFSYIFSTGSFIDSLSVKGKIRNAFDHKAEKGIIVMLYSDMSDSVVYKKLPEYFAKTGADGSFEIKNIREGKYKIVALKDANSNFKYDGDAESIAFTDTLVDPSSEKVISLDLFQEPAKKIFIKKYNHPSYGKIVVTLNQGSDSIAITNLTNDKKGVQEFTEFSKNRDTLTYWLKNYDKDSLKLQIKNGSSVIDTLEFKMIKFEDAVKLKRNPLKLLLERSPDGNQSFELGQEILLTFNHPLASHTDSVRMKEDSTELPDIHIDPRGGRVIGLSTSGDSVMVEDPMTPWEIFMNASKGSIRPLKENTKYRLLVSPGTLTDIFGLKNDSIMINFKTREAKYYGSLRLKIDAPGFGEKAEVNHGNANEPGKVYEPRGKYIIQLLNDREVLVRENIIKGTETINYEYLSPNKYKVKIIYDSNGNGRWDSGDYLKKIQPEKVIYNKEEINIRSNWDAEIDWKITDNQ